MIAVVTVGEYSDRAIDFVEHPDRGELLATLRSLEKLTDIALYAIAQDMELLPDRDGDSQETSSLAALVQPYLMRLREDVLNALPPAVQRDALRLRLESARENVETARLWGSQWSDAVAEREALVKDLEARLA